MKDEWESMPKDVNRNQYLKRINELIKSMKSQNVDIRGILVDIKAIRGETVDVVEDIKKVDADVEDVIYKDTKDSVSKEIYEELQSLKRQFDTIVANAQEENKLRT
jgi:hypothetical protein